MRPTHLLCGVALAGALLTTGCGGDREPEQFSTAQVAEFFHEVTGDSLRAQPGDDLDALSIERGDSGRYGSFYIVVMRKPDDEDFYKIENALPLKVEQRGIYWHQEGASWTAMKRYGNVVLAWRADERELDDRFERLHTVLTGLGEPPEQIRAKLAASRASSGTTLVVDRGQRLRLPNLEVRLTRVADRAGRDPAERLRARAPRQGPLRARRRRAQEHRRRAAARALRRSPAGRRALYEQDNEATFTVTPLHAFPLAPNASTPAALVFDVPADAGRAGGRGGRARLPGRGQLRVDPIRRPDLRGRMPHRRRDAAGQAGR